MSVGKSPLLVRKVGYGDGLFLFRQVFEFYQSMNTINSKEHIREPSCKPVFHSFCFPSSAHPLSKVRPKSRFISHIGIVPQVQQSVGWVSRNVLCDPLGYVLI